MPISLPPSPIAMVSHGPARNRSSSKRRLGPDIIAAHVARGAVRGAAAALDRHRQPHAAPRARPQSTSSTDPPSVTTSSGIATPAARQRRAARRRARLIGAHTARTPMRRSAAPAAPRRPARRSPLPAACRPARRTRSSARSFPGAASASACTAPRSPPRAAANSGAMLRPDILLDHRLDRIDQRERGSCVAGRYSAARLVLRRSVISMLPGAWVMQNSGFTAAITDCGVTPQAQNTGSSPSPTGTASP